MAWRPLTPQHAIERVRIVVRFKNALPSKFLRKLAADREPSRVSLGFNSKNVRDGQELKVGPSGIQIGGTPQDIHGWDWRKLSAANSTLESLILENSVLVYETSQYSRWAGFMDRFQAVAVPTLSDIMEVADLASLSLEYVDRFLFDGKLAEAAPDELLVGVAENLHDDAASGKELWHFHRGWFEMADDIKLLVNQNVDAQEGQMSNGAPARSIQIFTKTEFRPNDVQFDFATLRPYLDVMHRRSIELFREIVRPEIHEDVGLSRI